MGIRGGSGTEHRIREDGKRLDSVVVVHCMMTTTLFILIARIHVIRIILIVVAMVVVCGRLDLK